MKPSHHPNRRETLAALAGLSLSALPMAGHAEDPIPLLKILFGYPTAGVGSLVTMGVGERMAGGYAKAVVVDSRPGAAGRLVVDLVKSAPADGTAVYVTPSSVLALYPHVYKKLNYDPFGDMVPVSNLCEFVHGLAVGPAVPDSVKNVADFITWCKANPKMASVGNPGEGSLPHLLTLLLGQSTGVRFEAIAYAGGPPGVKDLLGGQLPAMMANEAQFATFVAEGKLRLLATSGGQRSRFSPAVSTFAEQGVRSIQIGEWIGMFAPARTPAAVVERISQSVRTALQNPELAANFARYAIQPAPSTPAELGRRLRADHDFWGPVVRTTGFNPMS